jgi:hypothetical protein
VALLFAGSTGVKSGKAMARTGLRMMPTFPSPPLKSVRRVFPGTASRPEYQTRPSHPTGLPSSFVLSASIEIPCSVSGAMCL